MNHHAIGAQIDPTLVRLIFVFGSLITGSALFWAYIVMMFVVPEKQAASDTIVDMPSDSEPEEE